MELCKSGIDSYEYCLQELEQDYEKLQEEINPFKNDYFKGLSMEQIAELAKKSIRLTTENCKLTHALEEVRERCLCVLENVVNHSQQKIDFAESIKEKIDKVLGKKEKCSTNI